MKKLTASVLVAATIMIAPAWADSLEGSYGNTVTVTLQNSGVVRYHFNADHSYSMLTPDGAQVTGVWEETGGQICTIPAGGERSCLPANPGHVVGDTWVQPGADGSPMTVSITPGR